MVDGGFRCGRSESFREPTRDGMVFDADDVLLFRPRIDGDRLGVPIEVRQGLLSRRRGEPPELMEPLRHPRDSRVGGQRAGAPAYEDDRDDAQHRGRDHDEALQHDQFRRGDRDENPRGGDDQEDGATPVHSASGTPKFFEAYKVQRITSMHALDNGDLASVLERVGPLLTIWLLQAFKAARVIRSWAAGGRDAV